MGENMKKNYREEQELMESFEGGEWREEPLGDAQREAWAMAAEESLKKIKKQQISIKLNPADIRIIKAKALQTGIPYQNIIGALVHNYAIGKIRLEV